MCDCLWFGMGVCDGQCKCEKYVSMNSKEGRILSDKWSAVVKETLQPVRFEFAKSNGFTMTDGLRQNKNKYTVGVDLASDPDMNGRGGYNE